MRDFLTKNQKKKVYRNEKKCNYTDYILTFVRYPFHLTNFFNYVAFVSL